MRNFCGCAALAIALVLVSAEGAWAASDEYARIHTIAVISALGNEIETVSVGFTRFAGSNTYLRTDWNLDNEAIAVAGKLLAPRFTIKTVVVAPDAFADVKHGIFDNPWHDVGRRVAALPKNNGVDAYVVIFANPATMIADKQHGLFVLRDTGSSGIASAFTDYVVGVFDAATGDRIDYGTAKFPTHASVIGQATPLASCPNTMWGEKPEDLTADQVARMRQEFAWLIDKNLGYALASANLIQKADAAAASEQSGESPNPACRQELP